MARADDWREPELSVRYREDEGTQQHAFATLFAAAWRDDEGNVQTYSTDPTLSPELYKVARELKAEKTALEGGE